MDTLSNALCQIKNGYIAKHKLVVLPPSSLVFRVCKVLVARGFLDSVRWIHLSGVHSYDSVVVVLKYLGGKKQPAVKGIKRVSRPGSRIYAPTTKLPRLLGGLGLVIVSTNKGVMSASRAKSLGIGGEIICYVW